MCSEKEAVALVVFCVVIVIGNTIRLVNASIPPFDDATYAEMDSLFDVLSSRADSLYGDLGTHAPDTIHTGFGARYDHVPLRTTGIEEWVLVDTLEKPTASFPIAINNADLKTLQALPRIGPAMARRIVAYRNRHGPFTANNELLQIKGIGPKTLEKLLPLITLQIQPDSTKADSLQHKEAGNQNQERVIDAQLDRKTQSSSSSVMRSFSQAGSPFSRSLDISPVNSSATCSSRERNRHTGTSSTAANATKPINVINMTSQYPAAMLLGRRVGLYVT